MSNPNPLEAECPTCPCTSIDLQQKFGACVLHAPIKPATAPIEAQEAPGMPISEAKAILLNDPAFKAAYEAPDPEWEAEKAKIDAKIPHPEATQGDELYSILASRGIMNRADREAVMPALIAWRNTTATRMAVEARKAYEAKIQDLAVETYVHSKVAEWAESYKHPGDDQNPYLGLEGAGYASAQEHVLGLLPKWRDEALQAQLKEEPKS